VPKMLSFSGHDTIAVPEKILPVLESGIAERGIDKKRLPVRSGWCPQIESSPESWAMRAQLGYRA